MDSVDRIGLVIQAPDARAAVEAIATAESAGVGQVWMTQPGPGGPDTLAIFAAAAVRTARVKMGTAVVPTYPRHPLALAQQALTVTDLAPGRLRLGVGPSHHETIEGIYGLPMPDPLSHLAEYVAVLRALLWDGSVAHHGRFFAVTATLPRPARPPILMSALRTRAFELAGGIADGALSWLCPAPYLLERALPAIRAGAANAGRAAPPLVAHVPVAMSADRAEVFAAARAAFARAGRRPNYARMFDDAGFPPSADGRLSDALLETLVIAGDEDRVAAQLEDLLRLGLEELMVAMLPVKDPDREADRLVHLIGDLVRASNAMSSR